MPFSRQVIGILGGGQLARMLVLKAQQMGLQTLVLCQNINEPAALVAKNVVLGKTDSRKDLEKIFKSSHFITFESEFVPAHLLSLIQKKYRRVIIRPDLWALSKIQDRLFQKELLFDHHIPTLDYVKINSKDDLQLAFQVFKRAMVLKRRIGGYDGYGTFIIKTRADLESFKREFKGQETQFIAEPLVKFKSERSLIAVRSANGQIRFYPLIQSQQKNNQCDYVIGPTEHKASKNLKKKIQAFLEALDYSGVIAFELFELGSRLVVNELAPRVHNTGHFSMDAMNVDQFEMHLRAILGHNLPELHLKAPYFVMTNLLGQSHRQPSFKHFPTGQLHWYEKTENRPRRKMGHINYTGFNKNSLLKKALNERKNILL